MVIRKKTGDQVFKLDEIFFLEQFKLDEMPLRRRGWTKNPARGASGPNDVVQGPARVCSDA